MNSFTSMVMQLVATCYEKLYRRLLVVTDPRNQRMASLCFD